MDIAQHYQTLYALQDRVMEIVFETSYEFYLTGGTCLSRFYKPLRYSDDLDFFTHASSRYSLELKLIKQALAEAFKLEVYVEGKTFTRYIVEEKLQIDFVNDVAKRCGKPVQKGTFLIDTIDNILANKLTAIVGRDNAKDVFDLYMIDRFYDPDYSKVLKCAKEKMFFEIGDLIYRLNTFPLTLLNEIVLIEKDFLKDFDLKHIIEKIKEIEV